MKTLTVNRAGPATTVQDQGRQGFLTYGLSRGGAADPIGLLEGAALLHQSADLAAIEMVGMGGDFTSSADLRIALTGAEMRATIDGEAIAWNGSHLLPAGAVLSIGGAISGVYGYLSIGGGIDVPQVLGARSTHLNANIGGLIEDGDTFPIGRDTRDEINEMITRSDRFGGGEIRVLRSHQTALFGEDAVARFAATEFTRDNRGNRMGVRMAAEGQGFQIDGGLTVLSEAITQGDIQITGDGAPFVLMNECQTTGGYPRIGTVLPCDLPRVAQAQVGAPIRFRFVTLEEAVAIETRARADVKSINTRVSPRIRDPHDIADLLSYQLISGVTAGHEED